MTDKHKRTSPINLGGLTDAFELGGDGLNQYLDLETGEVVQFGDNTVQHLDMLLEMDAAHTLDSINAAIQREDMTDWDRELLYDAALVQLDTSARFLGLPRPDERSHVVYQAMRAFIETVSDKHLQHLLQLSIQGKGAFRRFTDVLIGYPPERSRWFEFKTDKVRQWVAKWLQQHDISPTV